MWSPLLALAVAAAPFAPTPGHPLLDVNGARLGMTLQAWKALPYRQIDTVAQGLEQICSDQPGADAAGLSLASEARGTVACAYADRVDEFVWPETVPLVGSFRAAGLRYEFVDGRLSRIVYHVKVQSYDALMAQLQASYGPPSQTIRDTAPSRRYGPYYRVRNVWTAKGVHIEMVDPDPSILTLSLSFTAQPAAAGAQVSAAETPPNSAARR